MRLIDTDSLGICKANLDVFVDKSYARGKNSVIEIIEQAPTVEAEPVRHGKWVFVEPGAVWCSECGMDSSLCDAETADETKRRIANGETPNYCPNCGAKMDLKE